MHYAGNAVIIIGAIMGPVKEDEFDEDKFDINGAAAAMVLGGYVSKFAARQFAGSAGTNFVSSYKKPILNQFQPINDFGFHLQGYRALHTSGDIAFLAAGAMSVVAASQEREEAAKPLRYMGLGLDLAGALTVVSAWHSVGLAGEDLYNLSENISSPEPQKLIHKAGSNLKTFSLLSQIGGGLVATGVGLVIIGTTSDDDSMTQIGIDFAVAGQIFYSWIAPWFMGVAGDNLKRAGKIIVQS